VIGTRLKYTPTPGHIVESGTLRDRHDHADLAGWMAVVRANYVFQVDHVDT
jgi:hypothetical protein